MLFLAEEEKQDLSLQCVNQQRVLEVIFILQEQNCFFFGLFSSLCYLIPTLSPILCWIMVKEK